LKAYATLNPHATFKLQVAGAPLKVLPTQRAWQKWRPDWPTSAHWYTLEVFCALLRAYLAEERRMGRQRTVREFVAEFDGLTGSLKQKQVLAEAGLSGAWLHDLLKGHKLRTAVAGRLLQVMQQSTRPVQPARLGLLGEEHLRASLVEHFQARPTTVHYKKKLGLDGGVPFLWEVTAAGRQSAARRFTMPATATSLRIWRQTTRQRSGSWLSVTSTSMSNASG
jgi:hypothetical protein